MPTVLRMEAVVEMLGSGSSGGRLIAEGIDNVAALVAETPEGVSVLAGTDLATEPGHVAREVLALIRLGLRPQRAVAAATSAARRYLGRATGFEVGEQADAVFYSADPFEEPSTLLSPVAVLRAGRRIR